MMWPFYVLSTVVVKIRRTLLKRPVVVVAEATQPRLCKGNGILPHLQMEVALMGFV